MRGGLLLARKEPGALENHVDLEVLPRQLGRIALRADLDAIAVHDQRFAFHGDRSGEFSVRGVVARQVGVGLRVAEVVDGDELQVVFFPGLVVDAHYVAAYVAVTVEGDSNVDARLRRVFATS